MQTLFQGRWNILTYLLIIGGAQVAQARVFNLNESWVAAYIRGTAGTSNIYGEAFRDTSGSASAFRLRDDVDYNFSGELGFTFILSPNAELQLGVEGLQTKNTKAKGYNGSSQLLEVDSQVTTFNPLLRLGLNIVNTGQSRASFFFGAGMTDIKVSNSYSKTAAGITTYGGGASYKEGWNGSTISYEAGLAWETFLFDNITFSAVAGWRQMEFSKLKYNGSTTAIRGGTTTTVSKGATVLDNTGEKVSLDMGGAYVGLAIRFYLPPLD